MKIIKTKKDSYRKTKLVDAKAGIGYLTDSGECVLTAENKTHYFTIHIPSDRILEIAAFALRCERKK